MRKTSTSTTSAFTAEAVAPESIKMRPSRLTIEKIRQFARAYVCTPVGGMVLN
ncbi:MAG: hypothetical protein K2K55_00935 [Duncaniella sp.]|nr:hypothetical protein [Duncaniella sp.]